MSSIPKPALPQVRPRRSSIAQAAAAEVPATETARQETPEFSTPLTAEPPAESTTPAAAKTGPTELADAPANDPSEAVPSSPPGVGEGRAAGTRTRAARSSAATTRQTATRRTRPMQEKRLGGSRDILLSAPEDLKERMVNTIAWTQPHTGIQHQQVFIRRAMAELCERLEKQYNNGEAFPPPAVADDAQYG